MLVVLSQQDTQLMFLKPAYAEVVTNVKILNCVRLYFLS